MTKHAKLDKKEVDDVLGGEEAWKNVQKTDGARRIGSPAHHRPGCLTAVGYGMHPCAEAAAEAAGAWLRRHLLLT
jgi:hypothetical protein